MGTLTDVGPAGLVPAAWTVTISAHTTSLVAERTLLIALCVMDVLLLAFLLAAYSEMDGPVLRVWRTVLAGGFVVTLAGTVGLALDPNQPALLAVSLYGWMVIPGLAYVRTGQSVEETPARSIYFFAAGASVGGALLYAAGHLAGVSPAATVVGGLVVVGIGQTAGIVTAALQNTASGGASAPS